MAVARVRDDELSVGVNLAGYFDSMVGVGEVARRVGTALDHAGVPVRRHNLGGRPDPLLESERPRREGGPAHPVNLVCANAEGMEGAFAELGAEFFAGRYTIGFWWWEVAAFPDRWLRAFDHLDELWVGSHHVADALAMPSPVPVVRLPLPVPEVPVGDGGPVEPADGFTFLFAFDYASVFERKNPLGLIEAYRRAFGPDDGARLVVKTLGGASHPEQHGRVVGAAGDRPDIEVLDGALSADEMAALTAGCDCYVSLHRSEGFGLTIAEAMLHGKPVIATAYSGPRDYLTEANGFPVGFRLVAIGPGKDPYPADGSWADPDLDQAAALMRRVVDHPEEARRRGARAREDVRAVYSPAAAGSAMAQRLRRICTLPVDPRGRVAPLDLTELTRRVRADPAPSPPGAALGALRRPLRRAVLRLIRPQAVKQRYVEEELLRVLRTLDERVTGLAASQATLEAELRELRKRGKEPS
ncbi:MAG TPA: glycosyltransferase family 4 protein [Thermoleophilaceae bacterium]|nr:glycosyltransferase family 4 protein [Thermoleophilaceae bacterium]